eukprot:Awhi_evm2s1358
MPPKFDPEAVHFVYLKCVGGAPPPPAALAPKVGAFGIPPKKVGDQIAADSKAYLGLKVTVQLRIQNRQATVAIIPSASSLIMAALKEPVRDRKKVKNVIHDGDIAFTEIVSIANQMREKSMAKQLAGTVCEILGTCRSIGCNIDGAPAQEMIYRVQNGEMDDQLV